MRTLLLSMPGDSEWIIALIVIVVAYAAYNYGKTVGKRSASGKDRT